MPDQPNRPQGRPYGGFSLWGVPYNRIDIHYAIENLKHAYRLDRDPDLAMENLLNNNERVVSRCGMLLQLSGLLLAISLYIANNPKYLPYAWQHFLFYFVVMIWLSSIVCLLWSLKHELPPTEHYRQDGDFELTARLFLRRMGLYNISLITTVSSFTIMVLLLSPFSTIVVDRIFGI